MKKISQRFMSILVCIILSMNAYANETTTWVKKNELEMRTRGAVLSKRFNNQEIRLVCSYVEKSENCQNFNFYAVTKFPNYTYRLDLLDKNASDMSVETVVSALENAQFYHLVVPGKNQFDRMLQFCLMMFIPILIIPFAISWGIQDFKNALKKARIESVNKRIERFTKAFREKKSKKISLNNRKYEMILKAIHYGISNQIELKREYKNL